MSLRKPRLNRDLIPQYGQLFLLKQDAGFTGKQRLFLPAQLTFLRGFLKAQKRQLSREEKSLLSGKASILLQQEKLAVLGDEFLKDMEFRPGCPERLTLLADNAAGFLMHFQRTKPSRCSARS
jgi:hypothetical protein